VHTQSLLSYSDSAVVGDRLLLEQQLLVYLLTDHSAVGGGLLGLRRLGRGALPLRGGLAHLGYTGAAGSCARMVVVAPGCGQAACQMAAGLRGERGNSQQGAEVLCGSQKEGPRFLLPEHNCRAFRGNRQRLWPAPRSGGAAQLRSAATARRPPQRFQRMPPKVEPEPVPIDDNETAKKGGCCGCCKGAVAPDGPVKVDPAFWGEKK
jgi:hypothetical protein